jgi:hypothetical protein
MCRVLATAPVNPMFPPSCKAAVANVVPAGVAGIETAAFPVEPLCVRASVLAPLVPAANADEIDQVSFAPVAPVKY